MCSAFETEYNDATVARYLIYFHIIDVVKLNSLEDLEPL